MKTPSELVSELPYCDSSAHLFAECIAANKPLDKQVRQVYVQRLDACDLKIRFAAKAYLKMRKIISELQHGEFIYFDDVSKLDTSFYAESFLIFLRAALDLAISGYFCYFGEKTSLDSFNDFLKQVGRQHDAGLTVKWLPATSRDFWLEVHNEYKSEFPYTWLHALVGRDRGMSLRDLVIHKQNVKIETDIDDNDKGQFTIVLGKYNEERLGPWLDQMFDSVQVILDRIKRDIMSAESSQQMG